MKFVLFIFLCFACVACGSPQDQIPTSSYSSLVITLERTACFGTCPAYRLTIYGDGRVVYEGKAYVAVRDKQTAQISPEQLKELVAAFERSGYFSLKDSYTYPATDLPTTITSISFNGRSKRISHYGIGGGSEYDSAPKELDQLESKIDEIVNSKQWVGR